MSKSLYLREKKLIHFASTQVQITPFIAMIDDALTDFEGVLVRFITCKFEREHFETKSLFALSNYVK